jgi:hypothetical protein
MAGVASVRTIATPRRAVAVLIGVALVGAAMAGCSAKVTPLCARAEALTRQGKLGDAAEVYAEALRAKEGSCADKGLAVVAGSQAESMTATAKGQAAENAGDLTTARQQYRTAVAIDAGNAQAAAGLVRVTRRPAAIGPLWFRAQRLHDEGYDAAARAEIVRVLRAHPDETVPAGLARLAVAATATARPTPAASTGPTTPSSAKPAGAIPWRLWGLWLLALLLVGGLCVVGYLFWRALRDLEWRVTDMEEPADALAGRLGPAPAQLALPAAPVVPVAPSERAPAERDGVPLQQSSSLPSEQPKEVKVLAASVAGVSEAVDELRLDVGCQRERTDQLFSRLARLASGSTVENRKYYAETRPRRVVAAPVNGHHPDGQLIDVRVFRILHGRPGGVFAKPSAAIDHQGWLLIKRVIARVTAADLELGTAPSSASPESPRQDHAGLEAIHDSLDSALMKVSVDPHSERCTEFWTTRVSENLATFAEGLSDAREQWQRLILGDPVHLIGTTAPFTPPSVDVLETVAGEIPLPGDTVRTAERIVGFTCLVVQPGPGRPRTVMEACLTSLAHDFLSQSLAGELGRAVSDMLAPVGGQDLDLGAPGERQHDHELRQRREAVLLTDELRQERLRRLSLQRRAASGGSPQ